MYVAVEGCGHGELDGIYAGIQAVERARNIKVDLLIICGDFQAVRNTSDLQCMAVPPKYYTMGTFYKYYSGQLTAPVLTLVVGGNHEASNFMQALAFGGWLAPNIYYVGYAAVLRLGSLRLGALSGIYNGRDYLKGHHERAPYDKSTMRTAYHVRNMETFRLKQLTPEMDVFVSHDWPRGVYHHGDVEQLLRKKPFFREEVEANKLGSRPAEELLNKLQPRFWFAAHLHVKFSALVQHPGTSEPVEGAEKEESSAATAAAGDAGKAAADGAGTGRETRFLALDKCLPRRKYMQILELGEGPAELRYDLEWLTVLRLTDHLTSVSAAAQYMPGPGCNQRYDFRPSAEELADTTAVWGEDLRVPSDFEATVTPYDGESDMRAGRQPAAATDPQTSRFCKRLGIRDPMQLLCDAIPSSHTLRTAPADPSEVDLTLDADVTLDTDGDVTLDGDVTGEITLDDEDDMFVIDRTGTSPRARGPGTLRTPRLSPFPLTRPGARVKSSSTPLTPLSRSPASKLAPPVSKLVLPEPSSVSKPPESSPVSKLVLPAPKMVPGLKQDELVAPDDHDATATKYAVEATDDKVKATGDSVKATDSPVKATGDSVKAPDVPVKAPEAPVKEPEAPVKVPDGPVKATQDAEAGKPTTPGVSPAKKFKRRNQAIYNAEEED